MVAQAAAAPGHAAPLTDGAAAAGSATPSTGGEGRPLALHATGGRLTLDLAGGGGAAGAPEESGGDAKLKKPRTISGTAYAGSVIQSWSGPYVIDIAGIRLPESGATKPLLLNHAKPWLLSQNEDRRVGFVESFTREPGALKIAGKMLSNDTATRIVKDADDGYPFELSIQIDQIRRRMLRAGESAVVNGREIVGPMEVIDSCLLREVSVVELGADPETNTEMLRARLLAAAGLAAEARPSPIADRQSPNNGSRDPEPGTLHPSQEAPGTRTMSATDTTNQANQTTAVAEKAATVPELRALAGAAAAGDGFLLSCVERGLTLSAARDELNGRLAQMLAERLAPGADAAAAAKAGQTQHAQTSGAAALAQGAGHFAGSVAATGAGAGGETLTHNGQVFRTLSGAQGKDPDADWRNSEALRKHWKDNRSAFLMFAREQARTGDPFHVEA